MSEWLLSRVRVLTGPRFRDSMMVDGQGRVKREQDG